MCIELIVYMYIDGYLFREYKEYWKDIFKNHIEMTLHEM